MIEVHADVTEKLHELWKSLQTPVGVLGLCGQSCFFIRFLWQWVASERRGRSVVPVAFWWISICGAVLTLIYGISIGQAPLVIGQLTGLVPYIRNLVLISRHGPTGTA